MSRPQAVKIGPFAGGLNLASDPSAIADNELVECTNLELDLDGSLVCRPPIVEHEQVNGLVVDGVMEFIGSCIFDSGDSYLIGSAKRMVFYFSEAAGWSSVGAANIKSKVAIQYQNLVFVVATEDSPSNGGYWDGTTWTEDPNMPRGEAAIFHKQRMFIVPGMSRTGAAAHQLRYTEPISISAPTPLVWTATNLIPVGQGNGEKLVNIVAHNDNLLLFKQDSTYAFAFDSDPVDGILREINSNIGSSDTHCVAAFENSIFTLHKGIVYEVVNYDFNPISLKVPFELDAGGIPVGWANPVREQRSYLVTMGRRLIVRYYNRVYVYGLRTKSWSRWESASELLNMWGRPLELPSVIPTASMPIFYAGAVAYDDGLTVNNTSIYKIPLTSEGTETERTLAAAVTITCTILTKTFDAEEAHKFKRLMWWGADLMTTNTVTAVATPVTANYAVTWNDLHTHTWNSLHDNTWDQPLVNTLAYTTVATQNLGAGRKFLKFLKSLRWRQINFRVTMTSTGSVADGPCRLFGVTAILGTKQTLVKQVN